MPGADSPAGSQSTALWQALAGGGCEVTEAEATRPVPPYSHGEEADFSWYFSVGQRVFGWSTMGGMLARGESLAVEFKWPMVPVYGADGITVIGKESGITAWPTSETKEVSGYMPDGEAMTRAADVNRMLIKVGRIDAMSFNVISLLYGDAGQDWAPTEHGRNAAVYHFTVKGMALVNEAAKVPGALDVTPPVCIRSIVLADKAQPKPNRTLSLAVCARQAAKLEERARAVWHTAKST